MLGDLCDRESHCSEVIPVPARVAPYSSDPRPLDALDAQQPQPHRAEQTHGQRRANPDDQGGTTGCVPTDDPGEHELGRPASSSPRVRRTTSRLAMWATKTHVIPNISFVIIAQKV